MRYWVCKSLFQIYNYESSWSLKKSLINFHYYVSFYLLRALSYRKENIWIFKISPELCFVPVMDFFLWEGLSTCRKLSINRLSFRWADNFKPLRSNSEIITRVEHWFVYKVLTAVFSFIFFRTHIYGRKKYIYIFSQNVSLGKFCGEYRPFLFSL